MITVPWEKIPKWLSGVSMIGIVAIIAAQMIRADAVICADRSVLSKSCDAVSVSVQLVERARWKKDADPVKLMKVSDGVCAFASVTGKFEGGGEYVSVYSRVNPGDSEKWWYVGGNSLQEGVAAEAICFSIVPTSDHSDVESP